MREKREGIPLKKSHSKCDELEGVYANLFKVGFNVYEFVLDFGQTFSEKGREKYHTRIVTTPEYVKQLLELLQQTYEEFEKSDLKRSKGI